MSTNVISLDRHRHRNDFLREIAPMVAHKAELTKLYARPFVSLEDDAVAAVELRMPDAVRAILTEYDRMIAAVALRHGIPWPDPTQ